MESQRPGGGGNISRLRAKIHLETKRKPQQKQGKTRGIDVQSNPDPISGLRRKGMTQSLHKLITNMGILTRHTPPVHQKRQFDFTFTHPTSTSALDQTVSKQTRHMQPYTMEEVQGRMVRAMEKNPTASTKYGSMPPPDSVGSKNEPTPSTTTSQSEADVENADTYSAMPSPISPYGSMPDPERANAPTPAAATEAPEKSHDAPTDAPPSYDEAVAKTQLKVEDFASTIISTLGAHGQMTHIGSGSFKDASTIPVTLLTDFLNKTESGNLGPITPNQLQELKDTITVFSKKEKAVLLTPKLNPRGATATEADHEAAIKDYADDIANNKMIRGRLREAGLSEENLLVNHVITFGGNEGLMNVHEEGYEKAYSVEALDLSKFGISGTVQTDEAKVLFIAGETSKGYMNLNNAGIVAIDIAGRNQMPGKDINGKPYVKCMDWGHAGQVNDQGIYIRENREGLPLKMMPPESYGLYGYSQLSFSTKTDAYAQTMTIVERLLGNGFNQVMGSPLGVLTNSLVTGEVAENGLPKIVWEGDGSEGFKGLKNMKQFQALSTATQNLIIDGLQSNPDDRPTMTELHAMINETRSIIEITARDEW